jgi:mxaK protein
MHLNFLKQPIAWTILGLASLGVVLSGWNGYNISRENKWIAALITGSDIDVAAITSSRPETRLARAVYLHQKHQPQEALATLGVILNQGDSALQAKIRYNLGNIYLSQAITQVEAGNSDDARTLVTLAKQAYKDALLLDSQFGDTKYNLEVAMRLLPDFDRVTVEEDNGPQPKNQLWTTVPGFPRGLP